MSVTVDTISWGVQRQDAAGQGHTIISTRSVQGTVRRQWGCVCEPSCRMLFEASRRLPYCQRLQPECRVPRCGTRRLLMQRQQLPHCCDSCRLRRSSFSRSSGLPATKSTRLIKDSLKQLACSGEIGKTCKGPASSGPSGTGEPMRFIADMWCSGTDR